MTTPSDPGATIAHLIHQVIERWRLMALGLDRSTLPGGMNEGASLRYCADTLEKELEAVLRASSGSPQTWAIQYGIDRIIDAVAELPDRTSPDDWPDAMLVTADELRAIVKAEIEALLVPAPPAPAPKE